MSTVVVLEFVVDGLDVGDADTALVPHPRRRFAQNLVETLEHRHGELRSGVEIRRHEVGATCTPHATAGAVGTRTKTSPC